MVPTSAWNFPLAADATRPIRSVCVEINNLPCGHLRIPDTASLRKPASYLWHVPYFDFAKSFSMYHGVIGIPTNWMISILCCTCKHHIIENMLNKYWKAVHEVCTHNVTFASLMDWERNRGSNWKLRQICNCFALLLIRKKKKLFKLNN